jgi:hypothetical protein
MFDFTAFSRRADHGGLKRLCVAHLAQGGHLWPGDEETWRKTMQTVMKFALALALAGGVALTALSLTGATAGPRDHQCIPQYDTSGAQTAPYC